MITREELIESFIYNSNIIDKPKMVEVGFFLTDGHRNLSFSGLRNIGKTTFLVKFLIDDFLNDTFPKNYVFVSHDRKTNDHINDVVCHYLKELKILYDVVENRTKDYLLLKNGSIVNFDTKINRDSNILIIDDADYYFKGIETDYTLLYNLYLFTKDKNRRVIMSSYEPNDKLSENYIEYKKIIDKIDIPHFNVNGELFKLYTRSCKIKKIKNRNNG